MYQDLQNFANMFEHFHKGYCVVPNYHTEINFFFITQHIKSDLEYIFTCDFQIHNQCTMPQ